MKWPKIVYFPVSVADQVECMSSVLFKAGVSKIHMLNTLPAPTFGLFFCEVGVAYFGEGNGNPLQYSCLENPMEGGAWQATIHGVAKSPTGLSDFNSFAYFNWRIITLQYYDGF